MYNSADELINDEFGTFSGKTAYTACTVLQSINCHCLLLPMSFHMHCVLKEGTRP